MRFVGICRLGTVRYLVRSVPYLIQFLAPPRCAGTCLLGLSVPRLVSHTCRDHVSFDDTHIHFDVLSFATFASYVGNQAGHVRA